MSPAIGHGHEHLLGPVAAYTKPDGNQEMISRCLCGLEEKRTLDPTGETVIKLSYRFGGLWFDPLDLVRLHPLPVVECPACDGLQGRLGPCEACGALGVVDGSSGEKISQRRLDVVS